MNTIVFSDKEDLGFSSADNLWWMSSFTLKCLHKGPRIWVMMERDRHWGVTHFGPQFRGQWKISCCYLVEVLWEDLLNTYLWSSDHWKKGQQWRWLSEQSFQVIFQNMLERHGFWQESHAAPYDFRLHGVQGKCGLHWPSEVQTGPLTGTVCDRAVVLPCGQCLVRDSFQYSE